MYTIETDHHCMLLFRLFVFTYFNNFYLFINNCLSPIEYRAPHMLILVLRGSMMMPCLRAKNMNLIGNTGEM